MSWRKDYLAALHARDQREQATKDVFDAYSRLADKSAQALKTVQAAGGAQRAPLEEKPSRGFKPASVVPSAADIRANLVEAQKKRAELQASLDKTTEELGRLQTKNTEDEQRIRELKAEKNILGTRLRDRDSELREKQKLLSDVQGENVSLDLELKMEIERNDKLVAENKELVDRWMARMGQEAEKMNLESKFT